MFNGKKKNNNNEESIAKYCRTGKFRAWTARSVREPWCVWRVARSCQSCPFKRERKGIVYVSSIVLFAQCFAPQFSVHFLSRLCVCLRNEVARMNIYIINARAKKRADDSPRRTFVVTQNEYIYNIYRKTNYTNAPRATYVERKKKTKFIISRLTFLLPIAIFFCFLSSLCLKPCCLRSFVFFFFSKV